METDKLIRLGICVTCQDERVTWHEITECDACYAKTLERLKDATPCEKWGHYYYYGGGKPGKSPRCIRCNYYER